MRAACLTERSAHRVVRTQKGSRCRQHRGPFRVMVACADRRLGIHASLPRLSHTSSGAPRYFMGVAMMSSRPVCRADLHAAQWGAPGVWAHPVRRAVIPRTHDPRGPVKVSMMSDLVVSPRDATIHGNPARLPHDVWPRSVVQQFLSGPYDPMGVSMMSGLAPCVERYLHQQCPHQPTAPTPRVLLSTAKGVCRSDT